MSLRDPFTIAEGTVLLGVAYLSNVTSTDSINNPTTCDNSTSSTPSASSTPNRDVAIGVGVGVPLGVIALLSLAWALWERRKLSQMEASLAASEGDYVGPYRPAQPPVELSATGSRAAELDSQHEPKYMDFRAEEPIESERHHKGVAFPGWFSSGS